MADLAALFEENGIQTCAIMPSVTSAIIWNRPVLLHLKSSTGSRLGHFVVLLPGGTRTSCQIWDGLHGPTQCAWRELAPALDGGALLTSEKRIGDPGAAVVAQSTQRGGPLCVAVMLAVLSLVLTLRNES